MKQEILNAIRMAETAGLKVYMRDPAKDSWFLYSDATGRIGYCEPYFAGFSISTVHKPNQTTGTGFRMTDGPLDACELDRATFERGFATAPSWASRRDVESVRKYRNMDEYRARGTFESAYQLVTLGA
jgi:hypothetical protein